MQSPPGQESAPEPEKTSPGVAEEAAAAADPELIMNAWKAYAATVEKNQPRVFATLMGNLPEIKPDGTLEVVLSSEAQRENFVKNIRPKLSSYIGKVVGGRGVEIIATVRAGASNGKRMYTEQDKLDFLMKKNPELGRMKSRLNLDFDD